MKVFIDTNVYLNFFSLTNEDLEELKKLTTLVNNETIKLLLPDQVIDEFYRNRDNKIATAIREFSAFHLKHDKFPNMAKGYSEYAELISLRDKYINLKKQIISNMHTDITQQNLKADILINELFEIATEIELNDDIYNAARRRYELGNPPGKRNSLGDSINWESFISIFPVEDNPYDSNPQRNDIHIISGDGDYYSEYDKELRKEFLAEEWEDRAEGNLIVYKSIGEFTRKHFPKEIKLASELEKYLYLNQLHSSSNYSTTHREIGKLTGISEFTDAEANRIVSIYYDNPQVRRIINDEDVLSFMLNIIEQHGEKIQDKLQLQTIVNSMKDDTGDNEIDSLIRFFHEKYGKEVVYSEK